jgi:hypothetical protein
MPFEHTIDVSSLVLLCSYINPTKIKKYINQTKIKKYEPIDRENQDVNEITPKVIGFKFNTVPYFSYLHEISI